MMMSITIMLNQVTKLFNSSGDDHIYHQSSRGDRAKSNAPRKLPCILTFLSRLSSTKLELRGPSHAFILPPPLSHEVELSQTLARAACLLIGYDACDCDWQRVGFSLN